MGLISSGIDNVMVFELPGGIREDGSIVALPRIALVKWRSTLSDEIYQVYINGRLAGATFSTEQRQMVVQIPTSLQTAVRIEVYGVDIAERDDDFSDEISSLNVDSARVKICLMRSQELPLGSKLQIYSNGGDGEIDYDNPLNDSSIRVWPIRQDKAGFGLARFGASDFGYDSAAAVGFGKGIFGHGPFGMGSDAIEWVSEQLSAGIYKFGIKITDEAGKDSAASETREVVVIPGAKPAEEVSVSSFDKLTNQLVLSVS